MADLEFRQGRRVTRAPVGRADPAQLPVVVVGGGWAGLAAAVELAAAGLPVQLHEMAPQLGGRARGIQLQACDRPVRLDNGQHLLVGAYRETLRLVTRVTGDPWRVLSARPLRLESTDGLRLRSAPLPSPLHWSLALLDARGMSLADRMALVRLMSTLARSRWRAAPGSTVSHLLARLKQTPSLNRRLWEPLCVAALNTTADEACAQTFANVLRDTLGSDRAASRFLLPRGTLSEVLPEPAAEWLRGRGASIHLRSRVTRIERHGAHWRVSTASNTFDAAQVVLAVPPHAVAGLLGEVAAAAIAPLAALHYDAIATVYLGWRTHRHPSAPSLPAALMLVESAGRQQYGQWLFDRGRQQDLRLAAVVISAAGRVGELDARVVADGVAEQVADQCGGLRADWAQTVREKRATFRCVPDRPRIESDHLHRAGLEHLWLAGDYAWPDYPATIEAAVRSGVYAAALVLDAAALDPVGPGASRRGRTGQDAAKATSATRPREPGRSAPAR